MLSFDINLVRMTYNDSRGAHINSEAGRTGRVFNVEYRPKMGCFILKFLKHGEASKEIFNCKEAKCFILSVLFTSQIDSTEIIVGISVKIQKICSNNYTMHWYLTTTMQTTHYNDIITKIWSIVWSIYIWDQIKRVLFFFFGVIYFHLQYTKTM